MDKSWMQIGNRVLQEYRNGVRSFLDFASMHATSGQISCPYKRCNNPVFKTRDDVEADLLMFGIVPSYTRWTMHGEESFTSQVGENDNSTDDEDVFEILEDHFGAFKTDNWIAKGESRKHSYDQEPNEDASKFYRLLNDAKKELYPGCQKYSKLSFIMKLFHLKSLGGWSNKSFILVLELLKDAFSEGTDLPNNYYETRKILQDLGLHYSKIHACSNNCQLYWKENANANECSVCGESRWKPNETNKKKKIPQKVLRYFPLTPRLRRLYMSRKTASSMTWHLNGRVEDGVLRHPADTIAWKTLDESYSLFALEPRNVRLGLASDGFNPFGNMSLSYSVWLVILIPYNLPPWMCMKEPYFMLPLLIPGPKGPGNDIDIFLQPLVDELKFLWDVGVETYDASLKQNFNMCAALLWTVNDFPALGNLSGWNTRGTLACPSCNFDTRSLYLKNSGKMCYMGHRRFLPIEHEWRLQRELFDGFIEEKLPPKNLSGSDILEQVNQLGEHVFGKSVKRRKRSKDWLKKSIFFELPYWSTLLLRHNLDVMHIEKNVCENIISTLLNIKGRTKDNLKSRLDLQKMDIRRELHPIQEGNKLYLPASCCPLSLEERNAFVSI